MLEIDSSKTDCLLSGSNAVLEMICDEIENKKGFFIGAKLK